MKKNLELTPPPASRSEIAIVFGALFSVIILFAWIPMLIKISEYEISPNATMFNSFWIAIAILGLWNGVSFLKRRWSGNFMTIKSFPNAGHKSWLLLLMLGVFSEGQQLFYAWSFVQTSLANSEVLHSLTPLFTTLVGWMWLGQEFDRRFLLGIAIAIGGSIALAVNDISITLDKLQGDGLALVSAVFWGCYLMVVEKLQTRLSVTAIATWEKALSTVFLLPILLISSDQVFPHTVCGWLSVTLLAIDEIATISPIAYTLKRLSSGLVATILLLHPAITALLAWRFFSETLSLLNLLGFVVILVGVYLATLSKGGVKTT